MGGGQTSDPPRPSHHRTVKNGAPPRMASNFFTETEQARYAHLIAAYRAERLGLPQPAPTYLNDEQDNDQ